MERTYKIWHYKRANERIIYREFDWMVQYLCSWMIRSSNKNSAQRFLHEQEAVSTLVVIKSQWELRTEEEYIEEKIENLRNKEKQSWSEL